jgi:hypothetical protein
MHFQSSYYFIVSIFTDRLGLETSSLYFRSGFLFGIRSHLEYVSFSSKISCSSFRNTLA